MRIPSYAPTTVVPDGPGLKAMREATGLSEWAEAGMLRTTPQAIRAAKENYLEKLSEKSHERAKRLTITRVIAT